MTDTTAAPEGAEGAGPPGTTSPGTTSPGIAAPAGWRALVRDLTPYLLAGGAFWLLVAYTAWHVPIAADFGQHASAVQRVKENWRHPANPLLRTAGAGSPYYSPYIVTLGLFARATGAAGWQVVRWCGPLNLAVLVAGVGAYARTLSRRPTAPVYALTAFTLLWGVRGNQWSGFSGVWSLTRGASYPSTFAVGLTLLLWAWTDRLARRPPARPVAYAGLGAAVGALMLIHPITALAAAVGIAAVLAARQRDWSRPVAARWTLGAAVALAVTAAWPYFDVFSLAGDTTVDQVHRRLYAHPWQWYGLAAVGLPALAGRALRRPRDPLVLMFPAFCLVAAYGWFSGHYTYGRVFALLPAPAQFALAVELAEVPPWTRLRAVLAPLAVIALCYGLLAQVGAVLPQRLLPVTVAHPTRWSDYRWAADRIGTDGVVLTDGFYPTHVLPAYGMFMVAPTWPDPSTPAAERTRRAADVAAYLSRRTSAATRAAIVRRYGVRWLLLTRGQRVPYDGTSVAVKARTGERLIRLTPP